jgi:hypothetical protein
MSTTSFLRVVAASLVDVSVDFPGSSRTRGRCCVYRCKCPCMTKGAEGDSVCGRCQHGQMYHRVDPTATSPVSSSAATSGSSRAVSSSSIRFHEERAAAVDDLEKRAMMKLAKARRANVEEGKHQRDDGVALLLQEAFLLLVQALDMLSDQLRDEQERGEVGAATERRMQILMQHCDTVKAAIDTRVAAAAASGAAAPSSSSQHHLQHNAESRAFSGACAGSSAVSSAKLALCSTAPSAKHAAAAACETCKGCGEIFSGNFCHCCGRRGGGYY